MNSHSTLLTKIYRLTSGSAKQKTINDFISSSGHWEYDIDLSKEMVDGLVSNGSSECMLKSVLVQNSFVIIMYMDTNMLPSLSPLYMERIVEKWRARG